MTAHNHTEVVPGCFRCEISADETRRATPNVARPATESDAQPDPAPGGSGTVSGAVAADFEPAPETSEAERLALAERIRYVFGIGPNEMFASAGRPAPATGADAEGES